MRFLIVPMLILLALPAAAEETTHGMAHMDAPAVNCDHAFAAGMAKMHRDMMKQTSGDTDRDFAAMMIPHHQGAIDMARAELQCGKDAQLRDLATKIVAAQEDEIKFMQGWLASHPAAR